MNDLELAELLEEAARRLRERSNVTQHQSAKTSYLSITQAAIRMGLSCWSVRKIARLGKIQASKVHGDWQITEGAVKNYLALQRDMGANKALLNAMKPRRIIL